MKRFLFIFLLLPWCISAVYGQTNKVTGKVIDDKGAGLPGVSVKIKGATGGGVTNGDGNFSITAPANATLIFASVGYESKEVPLGTRTNITVTLSGASKELDQVVVVGYGTQRKSQVATAVGSIEGRSIAQRGTVSAIQGAQGQVAGVDIAASSGRTGANYNIQIRGQNSLAGGQPLYVVDGVIVPDINFLNPQDIERFDILKDAASTAIYGSRGSNGVVLVTTKNGTSVKGSTSISYDGYVGIRNVTRMPDFMTGPEWWEYRQNTYISPEILAGRTYDKTIGSLGNQAILDRVANNDYTDWIDMVVKNGVQSNHWLTVSGAAPENKIRYLIGAGYQNEQGNFEKDDISKYNFKASVDGIINDKWSAGMSFNFSLTDQERGSDVAIRNAFSMAPIFKPYDASGNLVFRPGQIPVPNSTAVTSLTSTVNPLLEIPNTDNNTRRNFGVGSLYLQYSPVKWIDIRSNFQPSFGYSRNGRFWGSLTTEGDGLLPDAQRVNQSTFSYILDNIATVRKNIKDHSFTLTGLYSIQKDRFEQDSTRVNDLPFNSSFYNLGSSANRQKSTSEFSQFSLVSYLLRLNYSYKGKYFATIASRWDGSSKLADGYKWSSFPSAAVAWTVSQEDFLKDSKYISDLKLRFSAGIAGNNNSVRPYETQATLSSPSYYDYGGTPALGYVPTRLPNTSLTWERTTEYDLGLDYGFFKGRVSGSIDAYTKLSKGLILDRRIPIENGYSSILDNVSSVRNKGIEFSLKTINVSTKDFTWTTSFTFARNVNSIIELLNGKQDLVGNKWFIGQPINVNYTYVFDGIWQESERATAITYGQLPGQAKVKDLNNDGSITTADRQIIGQKDPKWTGGFSTQVNFKSFDLSASLFARQGQQIYSPFHAQFIRYNDRGTLKVNNEYYMPENGVTPARSSNTYPQPNNIGPYWDGITGVGYYKSASFVKVQNIALGYTFSSKILEKAHLQNLRIYMNVLNPFIWTKFDGFDPETASGIDSSTYTNDSQGSINNISPSAVIYQFGLNVKF